MNVQVDVQIACADAWVPGEGEIGGWLRHAILAVGREGRVQVAVRVVDAEEMQALNRDYRRQDKPTNVLSFPGGTIDGLPSEENAPLGDIVICASVVSAEAQSQGKTIAAHWALMIVHGALHLLGFDHETDAGAERMESLETRILTANGVADPYGESPLEN